MNQIDYPLSPPSHVSRLNQASAKFQRVKLLLKRRWWILLLFATAGIFLAAWKVRTEPVIFESYGALVSGGQITMQDGPQYRENASHFFGTQQEIIKSSEVLRGAEEDVAALYPDLERSEVKIDVFRDRDSAIFKVRAQGQNPDYVRAMLDEVLKEYISYRSELRSKTSNNSIDAITAQIVRLERQSAETEKNLKAFTDQHNVVVLEEGGNSAAVYLASLSSKKASLETEKELLGRLDIDQNIDRRADAAANRDSADGDNGTSSHSSGLLGPEADYLGAKKELELLKARKLSLGRDLKPNHPDMLALDELLAQQETLIGIFRQQSLDKFRQRQASIQVQIENLTEVIEEWEARALELSSLLNEYAALKAERARVDLLTDRLTVALRELDINSNLQQENVSIMNRATPPVEANDDAVQTVAYGGGFGLVIGLLLLFLIDRLDDRINTFSEFQANFTEDILGQIPEQTTKGRVGLVRSDDDRHLYTEAFRNLRSSIYFKDWKPAPPKTILITSAVPAEGKTTIAGSLAYTMALSGARVLLVDGDIRRGALHEMLGTDNRNGLSEILAGSLKWQDATRHGPIDNLFFIPRGVGADHSSERFLGGLARRFIAEIREQFDYVVVDSAPVLVADDTTTFAPMIDKTLFVIRMSSTNARLSAKALDLLYDRQVSVGGVILNRASTSLKEYSYYGYANYYTKGPAASKGTNKPPAQAALSA
ncbi:polysaccharide biosynthesis tyrosine autokinase [soil metagenome]